MAKYSQDLFDEIISEMMKEKRTFMEMMAELDVDENAIFDAQDRIAKRAQQESNQDALKKATGGKPEGKTEEKKKGKK